jgi:4-diphosphocytidyl-2-C-methyl-D-erythritol kinase
VSELTWWPAPAKLNLFLLVTGRRPDGYHDLQTIFQLIERCDRIGLTLRPDGAITRSAGMADVDPDKDLAVRAARALQRHTGTALGADIQVIKHIPAGGGLGGGSSDAASVLLALNALWGCDLSLPQLAELGLALGADVPVFILGQSAWGEGRGERLTAMSLPERWFLVIHPGIGVSTAEIFQAPELTRNSAVITIRAFSESRAVNVFEPVVCARRPQVAEALAWLRGQVDAHGAPLLAHMTGTGACVFASFERAADAQRVASLVPQQWSSFVARGLNRSPLHAMLPGHG